MVKPNDQCLEFFPGSTSHDTNRSIRLVGHRPRKPQTLCGQLRGVPKEDALDHSVDTGLNPCIAAAAARHAGSVPLVPTCVHADTPAGSVAHIESSHRDGTLGSIMKEHGRARRMPRPDSLIGVHEAATARLRAALHATKERTVAAGSDDRLLLEAERRVRRKVWLRKTLPLNLILLLPGLAFIGTRSKLVLAVFVFAYPFVFVIRTVLARALSAWIGTEDILIRREVERLRSTNQDPCDLDRAARP